MVLKYAKLTGDLIEFGYSHGEMTVDVKMPYSQFAESLGNIPGTLDDQVKIYIYMMLNLAEILS